MLIRLENKLVINSEYILYMTEKHNDTYIIRAYENDEIPNDNDSQVYTHIKMYDGQEIITPTPVEVICNLIQDLKSI